MKDKSLRPKVSVLLATLVGVLALCVSPAAQVQQDKNAKGLAHTEEAAIRTLPDETKRYAVIIGVDQYTADEQITPLVGAANDSQMLAQALITYAKFPADNVWVLNSRQAPGQQPMRSNIFKVLNSLKGQIGKDGMLVVAFSGHGIEKDGRGFLLPADALSNKDLVEEFAISVSGLKEMIKRTNAGQVLLVLDACRNDPTAGKGDSDNPLQKSMADELSLSNQGIEAFVTLYAASVGQRAYEDRTKQQGYFTTALVKGLQGDAQEEGNGRVTLRSLVRYVGEQVPLMVRRANISSEQKPYAEIGGDYRATDLLLATTTPKNPPRPKLADNNGKPPAPAAPTEGGIALFSTRGAKVSISAVAGDFRKELTATEAALSQNNLKPGEYKIVSELDGYVRKEQVVKVTAGDSQLVSLLLDPLTHSVTIKANVAAAKIEYGTKGDETLRVVELKNGQATLSGLRHGGEYVLRISPSEAGYDSYSETMTVSGDIAREYKLVKRLKENTLDADFSAEQWQLPASWRASSGLHIGGEGVGMLREEMGRYADLQIISNLELAGGPGVSFVIRAADEKNHYLVRLTGEKSHESPKKLRLYAVKGGKAQLIGNSLSLAAFDLSDQFVFVIKTTGNRFDFKIDDNTGRAEPLPVGAIIDENNTFNAGTVGLAARGGDQAKVLRFYVCPNQCPKQ